MKSLDLDSLGKEINKFASDRDWDQFHSVKNLVCALSVESAELLELFQWLKDEESNALQSNPQLLSKVEDEIADVFVYLMRILSKTNIDLESAVRQKLKKNADKYPIELSKGNAKKYTDF